MCTNFDYDLLAQQVAEIVDCLTDLCGGQIMLAIYAELLNEFITQDKLSSAQLLTSKLYEIADIPLYNREDDRSDNLKWIYVFSELLMDAIDDLLD